MSIPFPLRLFAALLLFLSTVASAISQDVDPGVFKLAAETASKLRTKIQEKLASDKSPRLARLRVDAFEGGEKALMVRGIFLNSAGAKNPALGEEPGKEFDSVNEQMQRELTVFLFDQLKEPLKLNDVLPLEVGDLFKSAVPRERHPHVVLQQAAIAAGGGALPVKGADEIKLDASRFGPEGQIILSGWIGKKLETAAWLEKAIAENLNGASKPVPLPPGQTTLEVQWRNSQELTAVEWKLSPESLQAAFSSAPQPALQRVRIDRVMLVHKFGTADNTGQNLSYHATLRGLKIRSDLATAIADDTVNEEVVRAIVKQRWPELFHEKEGQPSVLLNIQMLLDPKYIADDPATAIQKVVAERPELDGVRVDPGSRFDSHGLLLLSGIYSGFKDNGRDVLKDCAKGLPAADRGVVLKDLTDIPTQKMLRDLCIWSAEAINVDDEIRLGRLFFDAEGVLNLTGKVLTDTSTGQVKKRLLEMIKTLPAEQLKRIGPAVVKPMPETNTTLRREAMSLVSLTPRTPAPNAEPPLVVHMVVGGNSLTAHLRSLVAQDPKIWSGVVLWRGYFTPDGRYALKGAVDRLEQNDALRQQLGAAVAQPEWKDYATPSPLPVALSHLPMELFKKRLTDTQYVLPVWDGIAIEDLKYDRNARLLISGSVVGDGNTAQAAAILKRLIEESPKWRVRGGSDLEFVETSRLPTNGVIASITPFKIRDMLMWAAYPPDGNAEIGREMRDRAGDLLAVTLRHSRGDSGVWFLNAFYHNLCGENENAKRDLYRVLLIDRDDFTTNNGTRNARYELAERLQGKPRVQLENELEAVRRALSIGHWSIAIEP